MKLTNNLSEKEKKEANLKGWWSLPSKREPRGTIQVHNTVSGLEGVMGVKVRAHRIVKIKSTYTDRNGNYHINMGFRYNVHYALIFENSTGFKIWGNRSFLAPARYNMEWHSKNGYDLNIHTNSTSWKWATVNNGTYKYGRFCESYSILKPPSNLRIYVMDGSYVGSAPMLRRVYGYAFNNDPNKFKTFSDKEGIRMNFAFLKELIRFTIPDLIIKFNEKQTDVVYGLVFHELAHASHWSRVGNYYWRAYINYIIFHGAYGYGSGNCGVGEMWGNYFGAFLVRDEFNYEAAFPFNNSWYVTIGNITLLDEGEDWYNPGFLRRVDAIPDVTTTEIFYCLTSSTNTIDKLVNQIKTKTINDVQVDNAYSQYNDWP